VKKGKQEDERGRKRKNPTTYAKLILTNRKWERKREGEK
jgi:hypothetical protein